MRFYYDTEFIEDGRTIDLISIGIIAGDGREYYAINREAADGSLARRIRGHDWLMANVIPALPQPHGDWKTHMPQRWLFNRLDEAVQPLDTIAEQVRDFLLSDGEPELWAWYAAYDHVALAQLWGPMCDMPEGLPYWTNDLKQEHSRLGEPELPAQTGTAHNALDDARWSKEAAAVLRHEAAKMTS